MCKNIYRPVHRSCNDLELFTQSEWRGRRERRREIKKVSSLLGTEYQISNIKYQISTEKSFDIMTTKINTQFKLGALVVVLADVIPKVGLIELFLPILLI